MAKLDEVCQGRDIEWHWVKGHAGHPGNEMADQLANLGADETLKKSKQSPSMSEDKKKSEPDWLLDDPFGLDLADSEEELEDLPEEIIEVTVEEITQTEVLATDSNKDASSLEASTSTELHPQIVITPAKLQLHGPRQLILDTETTGFYYQDGDRIIEVGALEMINRKLTGSSIHIYINPKTPVGDSVNVHGITDESCKTNRCLKKFLKCCLTIYTTRKLLRITRPSI